MHNAHGCGLAAPQIGKSLQLFVLYFCSEEGSEPTSRVVINPKIEINEGASLTQASATATL